jgi:hypothetical protein
MSPTVIPPTNGLSYIPALNAGFNLGDNVRYPLTDHSGIQKFLRPWVNAFLNNQTAPSFKQDKIFAWYWLHPVNVEPTSTIPSVFSGYAHLNQTWWNNTVYGSGYINVGGGNQVYGIRYLNGNGFEKIRVAAHLTSPAKLRINDTLSETFPAGAAYFEIPMGTFRGVPTFAIVRTNSQDKTGSGPQAITNSVFPGGWNFLAVEIPLSITSTTNPTAPTFKFSGPTRGTINTASSNFTITPNNSYTGTITITPSGGGLSTPIVLSFTSATHQTFTITPTSVGKVTLTPTNNGSLTNPRALLYTACMNTGVRIKSCGN